MAVSTLDAAGGAAAAHESPALRRSRSCIVRVRQSHHGDAGRFFRHLDEAAETGRCALRAAGGACVCAGVAHVDTELPADAGCAAAAPVRVLRVTPTALPDHVRAAAHGVLLDADEDAEGTGGGGLTSVGRATVRRQRRDVLMCELYTAVGDLHREQSLRGLPRSVPSAHLGEAAQRDGADDDAGSPTSEGRRGSLARTRGGRPSWGGWLWGGADGTRGDGCCCCSRGAWTWCFEPPARGYAAVS